MDHNAESCRNLGVFGLRVLGSEFQARKMLGEGTGMNHVDSSKPQHSAARRATRGFTLTELMVVVAIVSVLAALAVVGYRRYVNAAHGTEALQMIGSIRAAEESYRSETLTYLNVSTQLDCFYPMDPYAAAGNKKYGWGGASVCSNNADGFRILNVHPDGPVMYGYSVVAGGPGAVAPAGIKLKTITPTFPTAAEPWFVVQAAGDINGDSTSGEWSVYVSSSFSSEVLSEYEGE